MSRARRVGGQAEQHLTSSTPTSHSPAISLCTPNKQVLSGVPTVVVLTCIEDEKAMVDSVSGLVDLLHKQLRVGVSFLFW